MILKRIFPFLHKMDIGMPYALSFGELSFINMNGYIY